MFWNGYLIPCLIWSLAVSGRVSGAGFHLNYATPGISINTHLAHLLFCFLVFCARTKTKQHCREHSKLPFHVNYYKRIHPSTYLILRMDSILLSPSDDQLFGQNHDVSIKPYQHKEPKNFSATSSPETPLSTILKPSRKLVSPCLTLQGSSLLNI